MIDSQKRTRDYRPRPNARKTVPVKGLPTIGESFGQDALPLEQILVGDCLVHLRRLPDRCVDLVILDPPYWKVVGELWDFKWRTEDDYRQWCREWFAEIARVSKRSASVYLFGYLRNLVYLFPDIIDLGFEFRQEIIVDKGMKCVAGRKTSTYNQFPNTTETILFFVYDAKPAIRECLLQRAKELDLDAKTINTRLGVKSNGGGMWSLYTGKNILAQVPTKEMWERLENVLDFRAPDDLKGFVFQPQVGLTNVWQDINFYAENRIHRTQKPLPLIERLLLASTRPGQVVLDPFAGSGSTAVVAKRLRRCSISIEIDPDMAAKAAKRLAAGERVQADLF